MFNPTRRNRNIGTAKQGLGKNNELVVPFPLYEMKSLFERLGRYTTVKRTVNGHAFRFVIESTREKSFHTCTIEDLERMLQFIPKEDYGELELIVLRQPTRNEEILKSVWGRLIYLYEFEGELQPAIILESVDTERKLKRSKKLSVDDRDEFERLLQDGHEFIDKKKYFETLMTLDFSRNTQLYRTFPHEFGHYVHYLEIVVRPLASLKRELDELDAKVADDDTAETNPYFHHWDRLFDEYHDAIRRREEGYFAIPSVEKEAFAHAYADRFKSSLEEQGRIPFDIILKKDFLREHKLNAADFDSL